MPHHPLRVRVAQAIAQKEAQTAGNRRPRLGDGDRCHDILRQAETAAIMFRCPAVYDPVRGYVVHLNDPTTIGLQVLTQDDVASLTEVHLWSTAAAAATTTTTDVSTARAGDVTVSR